MNTKLIVSGIVLVIVMGFGAWMLLNEDANPLPNEEIDFIKETAPTDIKPQSQTPSAAITANGQTAMPNPEPEAATTIEQDLEEIDAQMKGLQEDTAAIDQGLADTSEN